MTLSAGYLTSKQTQVWDLSRSGFKEASIARKLKVERQTIHKTLDIAIEKVGESLRETAKVNKIKVEKIDPSKGFLMGTSAHFKTKTLVTFSAKNGIQIWYRHEGDCKRCEQLQTCKETLLAEATDRRIPIPEDSGSFLPSEFARTLFAQITGEKE